MNAAIRDLALEHDAVVLDCALEESTYDLAAWAPDRLHPSLRGHARMAAGFADRLGVAVPPDVAAHFDGRAAPAVVGQREWLIRFAAPWVVRRVTGRSSGDGREPKRPTLSPWGSPTWS